MMERDDEGDRCEERHLTERADVVAEALRPFHQPADKSGLLPRHNGTWHDSLALTHCLCWGAAWRMLDYLLAHPDEFDALREANDG